jgi:hypothetical protein
MAIVESTQSTAQLARPFVGRGDKTLYAGSAMVAAGQTLKIETSPQGDDLLELECPAGKAWLVYVRMEVRESDA